VPDGDIPAGFDHVRDVLGGLFGGLVLVLDRLVRLVSLISELPPMATTASFLLDIVLFSMDYYAPAISSSGP
jgi:hypothetical protein